MVWNQEADEHETYCAIRIKVDWALNLGSKDITRTSERKASLEKKMVSSAPNEQSG